jgi:acyl-CoA synthetase (AMP-forming)/AMP-acid ligase II
VFGNRVNLDELETLLKVNLDGANFACIGIEDKYIIVFCDTKSVSLDEVRKAVMSKLKIHSSIIKHNYINSFPLTSNGKINYKELKNSYEI